MRFYQLTLSDATTGAIWTVASDGSIVLGPPAPVTTTASGGQVVQTLTSSPNRPAYTFTSHPSGIWSPPDPGALDIEFDAPVTFQHTPQNGFIICVRGVGLRALTQSVNLNGAAFTLSGGMGIGLPLAKPYQAGLLVQGTVVQAFGNWEGTEQCLYLSCIPGGADPLGGIGLDWQPGQTLDAVLNAALTQAYPSFETKVIGQIAPLTTLRGEAQPCFSRRLTDFSKSLQALTQAIGARQLGNPSYPGVRVFIDGQTIVATDSTVTPDAGLVTALQFEDLIGQPTWIAPAQITFQTVMRADLALSDVVSFPIGIFSPYALLSPQVGSSSPGAPARDASTFQGLFSITELHHFGHFRQADAGSWTTVFTANPLGVPSGP